MNEKRAKLRFLERFLNHPQKCKECRWFPICRGGCYRSHMDRIGEIQGMNYFYRGYEMFFDACYDKPEHVAELILRT